MSAFEHFQEMGRVTVLVDFARLSSFYC